MATYSKKELETKLKETNKKLKAYQDLVNDKLCWRDNRTFTRKFNGTLVIIDIINLLTDADWYNTFGGENLIEIGIDNYILLPIEEGDRVVIKDSEGEMIDSYFPYGDNILITTIEHIEKANKYMTKCLEESDCGLISIPAFDGELKVTNKDETGKRESEIVGTGEYPITIEIQPEETYLFKD